MAFLGNLFRKKPGGSFVGNLIRAGVSKATGGMLGTGANRIELGQTKTNKQLAVESTQPASSPNLLQSIGGALQQTAQNVASNFVVGAAESPEGKTLIKKGMSAWLQQNKWAYWVGGGFIIGIITLIFFAFRRKPARPFKKY